MRFQEVKPEKVVDALLEATNVYVLDKNENEVYHLNKMAVNEAMSYIATALVLSECYYFYSKKGGWDDENKKSTLCATVSS